jgi:PAS domain S-box-containing protein
MSAAATGDSEQRLLILLPTGKDSSLSVSLLSSAGILCAPCLDVRQLAGEMKQSVGAAMVAEEALSEDVVLVLAAVLREQPPWSDLPILVVARQGADSTTVEQAVQTLGNVTLLERPIRVGTLVSAVRTALRSRQRQYLFRQQFEALQRSERNLSDFFENAAVGLHLANADGIILRANQTELDMLGYTSEEYVGHHIAEFHVDSNAIANILARLRAGEALANSEAQVRAKDGSIRHVLISSNVLWEDGQFIHTRCFTRDITARKLAEDALLESDRRKDEFLATLAHELRNPLAPIRNSLHILHLTSNPEPAAARVYEMMERQVNHMVRLVDDLMEVSRITRGKIELRREPVELAAVVRNAVETSRPLIEAAGHQLALALPPEPLIVNGDLVRLSQVLANLLNNSAKYTLNGGQIWLAVCQDADDAVISVRDSGVGITSELLPRVFEMFSQGETSRGQGGLGIGLSLVKNLVEMHGGRVEARSAGPKQGSEFIVRLPRLRRSEGPRSQNLGTSRTQVLSPRRILVVDDNRDAAESLGALLRFLGADVRVVTDGPAALQILESFRPAVVLLDIGMPGMDGYEVAQHIRARAELDEIMLVALTGWSQEEDRRRSQSAGFNHHLVKPADLGALQAVLESARVISDRRSGSQ